MIMLFLKFLKRILNIANDKVKAEIHIQPNLSRNNAYNYWRNITGIPKENLRIYEVISRTSQRRRPGNLLPYGTVHIRVRSRKEYFKMKGVIDGIIKMI